MAHPCEFRLPLRHRKVLSPASITGLRTRGDPAPLLGAHRILLTTSYHPDAWHPRREVLIPHELHSLATFEFLGFATAAATALWERFCVLGEETTMGGRMPYVLGFVEEYLDGVEAEGLGDEKDGGFWWGGMGFEFEVAERVRGMGGRGALRALVRMRWRLLVLLDEVVRTGNRGLLSELHPAALAVGLR
ncbi:hypothetical protein MMC26_000073 [Xylographa opegraphella]|nr:hypothetical protein [Xylographa opegraphella]